MSDETATAPVEASAAAQPAEPVPLTPYQKKKAREAERKRKAEARRAKRAALVEGSGASDATSTDDAPAPASAQPVDEATLKRALEVWVRLLHRVAGWTCLMFGGALDKLTDQEVKDQAVHWLPWALAFPWFRTTVLWCAAPVLFLDLAASKFRRKEAPASKEPTR